jgi:hypothetical protein
VLLSNPGAFTALNWLFEVLAIAALVVEVWAFTDAIRRKAPAFVAAGKQTKPLWLIILGVATVIGLGTAASGSLSVIGILSVAAFVAAAVYLTDVKPKVSGSSGGSSHQGPYGPW